MPFLLLCFSEQFLSLPVLPRLLSLLLLLPLSLHFCPLPFMSLPVLSNSDLSPTPLLLKSVCLPFPPFCFASCPSSPSSEVLPSS
mmetsp:Transcript_31326/g.88833  ORF Transcript_31326/g.88833 Transcript_31326/m.88833 type:complete len:85 (-) Transcript_31326:54-308(-)